MPYGIGCLLVPTILRHRVVRSMAVAMAVAMAAGLAFAGAPTATSDATISSPLISGLGPRPGPEILYWPLASSPQLANVAPWKAEPILVSGASAYREGEFLYQDYLYDDYGADGDTENLNQTDRRGTYVYPTDPTYASNAADLVEIRLKPLAHGTAIRITYNTMHNPERVATTIALGTAATAYEMPHGANARAAAQVFVTVHGLVADIVDAATGTPLPDVTPSVSVSLDRRQVDIRIPYVAFDTRDKIIRVAAATGLWDMANNQYLLPGPGAPDATHPGGAGTLIRPTAFFNVAFRFTEPTFWTGATSFAEADVRNGNWRESQQATALATGDLSPFFVNVDFRKLAKHVNDDMRGQSQGIPETGFMSRILVSHFESAQGRGNATSLAPDACAEQPCVPDLAGRLQPYGIYIPTQPPPMSGYGLTIDLHGNGGNYNWLSDTPYVIQLGERGRGSIVVTPGGRGPSYWYYGQGAADVFEVWADVAARYAIDSDNVAISGISMGSYGVYKLAALFPDLFVAAAPVVPCPLESTLNGANWPILPLVPAYRHVPIFSWSMLADQFCWYAFSRAVGDKLTALAYRHEFLSGDGEHQSGWLAAVSDFSEVTEWLGDRRVQRDPAHVTYVLSEFMNEPQFGVNADHAYWIYDLRLRDNSTTLLGKVDVFSHGFGIGDPPALPTTVRAGVLKTTPPLAFVRESTELAPPPSIPPQNRLDITVRNIRALTINPKRARVDCDAELNVDTDGYVEIMLRGCDYKVVAYGGAPFDGGQR